MEAGRLPAAEKEEMQGEADSSLLQRTGLCSGLTMAEGGVPGVLLLPCPQPHPTLAALLHPVVSALETHTMKPHCELEGF